MPGDVEIVGDYLIFALLRIRIIGQGVSFGRTPGTGEYDAKP